MRSALLALGLLLVLAVPASAGPLVETCRGIEPGLTGACRAPEVFVAQGSAVCRNTTGQDVACTTPLGPEVDRRAVGRHERSALHRTLALQYQLAADLPFRETPWLGTHNSFNAASEMVTPSQTDANQQLSLTDQLRIDMRSLELDVHWFLGRPVLCHARSSAELHAGCSIERTYEDGLNEVAAWLDEHPKQVVMLYVEDHLDHAAAYDATAAATERALGDRVFRPEAPGCRGFGDAPTRREVRDAGAQVILISTCAAGTAWGALAFDDAERARNEGGSFSGCPGYEGVFKRFFEDSTGLSAGVAFTGGEPMDPGLTPVVVAEMVRCGVDLLGFDQILPGDGRLEAAVWSWTGGAPGAGRCAAQTPAGWEAISCGTTELPYACRAVDGGWTVAVSKCNTFDVPRTGFDARRLVEALESAGHDAARIALRRAGKSGWRASS